MRFIDGERLRASLDYASLIERLDQAFRLGCTQPLRHHHAIDMAGGAEATLLLMPAWRSGEYLGIKIVTVFPDNAARGLPAVMASYQLLSGDSGQPLALIDGEELTARRTAAASALASALPVAALIARRC